MNAKQYRAALKQLGMSQLAAGDLFEVGARTSRRWALDEARVPPAVAMVLKLMVNGELKLAVPMIDEDGRRVDGKERVWTFSAKAKEASPD